MRVRLLLETLLICVLVGGGTYLMMGSSISMKFIATIAGSVGGFVTEIGPRLLASPEAIVSLMGIAAIAVYVVCRKPSDRAFR